MDTITITNPGQVDMTPINPKILTIEVEDLAAISDGFHTIAELYDHRITLWIALCKMKNKLFIYTTEEDVAFDPNVWRSKLHFDGSVFEGSYILGITLKDGKQISYHLPLARWDETYFAETLDRAPLFDGHTSADVVERLKTL